MLVLRIKQELAMLLAGSMQQDIKAKPHIPVKTSKPQQQQPQIPNFGLLQIPQPQPMMYPMAPGMGMMYPVKQQCSPDDDNKDKLKKFLSPGAVKVLMDWYAVNEEHPYPEEETVQMLAMQAQVSPAQVNITNYGSSDNKI